ncbi:MAG: hypothetical protein M3461_18830 [Pseudomonadota bacterium]|nr:hypothetical protein [Pseudomonadota bacterium]
MGRLIDLAKAAMPLAGAVPETSGPAPLWWRVTITEPGGRTVEVDTPPAGPSPTGRPTPSATTALGAP